MITILVGHRGVGKSSLLKRIQTYGRSEVLGWDLDAEIESDQGRSIHQIFRTSGEKAFRALEIQVFERLLDRARSQQLPTYIAVGAGFVGWTRVPPDVDVLWIRRVTDGCGRIFLDRPRLDATLSATEEYQNRYQERDPRFAAHSRRCLWIPEGWDRINEAECRYFTQNLGQIGGVKVVSPKDWDRLDAWKDWGVDFFELRDDLLSFEEIQRGLTSLPHKKILYSFRSRERRRIELPSAIAVDWPVEWGSPAAEGIHATVLSLHERHPGESVGSAIQRLEALGQQQTGATVLKLAIRIDSFKELELGHRWAMADSRSRSFLPRSPAQWHSPVGKWAGYRLVTQGRMPLQFWTEGGDEVPDQPHLLDWLRMRSENHVERDRFAAVLGDPVFHSRTPAEHSDFFKEVLDIPAVVAIPVREEEWEEAILVLFRLGLRFAAVTSPLKKKAGELVGGVGSGALNTLHWSEDGFEHVTGVSTDEAGLQSLLAQVPLPVESDCVAIWGGGGVLDSIRSLLPCAQFWSIRSRALRFNSQAGDVPPWLPKVVIWAAPSRVSQTFFPPENWRPQWVVDLNYTEDSPAREFARQVGARYLSGMQMFKKQAELQREFWKKNGKKQISEVLR